MSHENEVNLRKKENLTIIYRSKLRKKKKKRRADNRKYIIVLSFIRN